MNAALVLVFVLGTPQGATPVAAGDSPGDELNVLDPAGQPAPGALLWNHLLEDALQLLAGHDRRRERRDSAAALREHQLIQRQELLWALGEFPARTPLRPRVTGVLERDGHRIEKVIFESRPGFHVTANFYLPAGEPPFPAVLVPCGHSQNGKAAETYQRGCILLARSGLAALCFDPIGQGERKQFLDGEGRPRFHATEEHMVLGPALVLLGRNLAGLMVWDGIRAIDYLQSRDDIDPERIGCAGNSGGGTQTSYLMAVDERIAAAAPSCYLTSLERLLVTIGPQDSEQNLAGQLVTGPDHVDYVLLRAPRPTLICAATRDFFDIGGTWQTFRTAKRAYGLLGFPERVDLVEANAEHGWSPLLRVATARWMRRWLLERDDAIDDPPAEIATDAELQCTPEGQVILLEGAHTVLDFNRREEELLAQTSGRRWSRRPGFELREQVRGVAGMHPPDALDPLRSQVVGTLQRDGYRIEKLRLQAPDGPLLPALRLVPEEHRGEPVLYLHEEGKHVEAGEEGALAALARAGHEVLAVDLPGIGETRHAGARGDYARHAGANWPCVLLAYLTGGSLLGRRADEILRCARFLAEQAQAPAVALHAVGETGPPALHAAAVEPTLFSKVKLERSLVSWSRVIHTPVPRNQWVQAVHLALRIYDLPDLVRLLPPGRVTIVDPRDADGEPWREPVR